MTVTVSLAIANYRANSNIAAQVVSDTAVNIVSYLDELEILVDRT